MAFFELLHSQLYLVEYSDDPRPWGLYFQDNASPQIEGLKELHNNIMFYLIIILLL
jgi:cytochrome c oxidase subunit 2